MAASSSGDLARIPLSAAELAVITSAAIDGDNGIGQWFSKHDVNFVDDFCLISSCFPATDRALLDRLRVTRVLTVGSGLETPFDGELTYLHLSTINDTPDEDILSYLDVAVKFVGDSVASRTHCLIHCMAGVSRSATCALAYMLSKEGGPQTPSQALRDLRHQRRRVSPNLGFWRQLQTYHAHRFNRSLDNASSSNFWLLHHMEEAARRMLREAAQGEGGMTWLMLMRRKREEETDSACLDPEELLRPEVFLEVWDSQKLRVPVLADVRTHVYRKLEDEALVIDMLSCSACGRHLAATDLHTLGPVGREAGVAAGTSNGRIQVQLHAVWW